MCRFTTNLLILGGFLATAVSAQTITVTLTSPQSGQNLFAGDTVNWSIGFTVSSGDNTGLALLVMDLAQDGGNPSFFDIPPAATVPASMANFSRPAGICNEGESNPNTGYTGLQRGATGARNLVQIGGAQNTLGQALPSGAGVAESVSVVAGIGQSGTVELASGSFEVPSAPGAYLFRLENVLGNVLAGVNPPPAYSPVVAAPNIETTDTTITFEVLPCDACDADCNGAHDGSDVHGFVSALLGGMPSPCSPCAGDMDGGGTVTSADVLAFVDCMLGP